MFELENDPKKGVFRVFFDGFFVKEAFLGLLFHRIYMKIILLTCKIVKKMGTQELHKKKHESWSKTPPPKIEC